jgi:hypothetical protein
VWLPTPFNLIATFVLTLGLLWLIVLIWRSPNKN